MRRREFIAGFCSTSALSTWPLVVRAQNLPVIGWLSGESREVDDFRVIPFRQGLKDSGYIEGRNVAIEYRWADAQYDRLPVLAADLVRRQVTVIVVTGLPPALAAKAATATIPIVFQFAADPVELGFVASLNRPGGNITGVTSLNVEVAPKQLELVHELVPAATDIALLVNPTNQLQSARTTRDARVAANALGLRLHVLHASTERDFDTVFATLGQLQAGALVIAPDPLFAGWQQQLGTLTVRHAVPAISPYSGFAMAGGLMSYGADLSDVYRRVGAYTSRILKGEEPSELPVQQAVKIEFVINLKTAKALRLMLPTALLVRADVVIE
jgi:putative tryptophan/tyrosine transport system substrate-binding protein